MSVQGRGRVRARCPGRRSGAVRDAVRSAGGVRDAGAVRDAVRCGKKN